MKIDDFNFDKYQEGLGGFDRIPQNNPIDPNDLEEIRIRRLIDSVSPDNQRSLIYFVPQLVVAAKNPIVAKRDWLISLYQKRGWIDSEVSSNLRELSENDVLSELENICLKNAILRTSDASIPIYQLPVPGEQLGDYIREILKTDGLNPNNLKVRHLLNYKRVNLALSTGCDRDYNSVNRCNHHSGYDGEELAMIRHGIISAGDTTYVSNLKNWRDSSKQEDYTVLIYSPDALEGIGPCGYMSSNQFHAFHFGGEIKQRSLLAVFKR